MMKTKAILFSLIALTFAFLWAISAAAYQQVTGPAGIDGRRALMVASAQDDEDETPTPTESPEPDDTSTSTHTPTFTYTPTATSTDIPTHTPTHTLTATSTDIPTNTPTHTPTNIPTNTPTNTPTHTPTATHQPPPVIDLNGGGTGTGYSTVHAAGGAPSDIMGSNATLTNTHLQSATITLKNLHHTGSEILKTGPLPGTLSGNYDPSTGVLIIAAKNEMVPVAQMLNVLKSITYEISGVANPDTEDREIEVTVSNDVATSNVAVATVKVIAPRISIVATSVASNTPIPIGGNTSFDVTITNHSNSNVNLDSIKIVSPTASQPDNNCTRSFPGLVLTPGDSHKISCNTTVEEGIEAPYFHAFSVEAKDVLLNTTVTASTTVRVRVLSPIVVGVSHLGEDPMLAVGDDAIFEIVVINPLADELREVSTEATIQYYDVDSGSYSDAEPLPACSEEDLGKIAGLGEKVYECTIPTVQTSFKIEVKAKGLVIGLTDEVEDIDGEEVAVADLLLEVSASPFAINAGTPTAVTFNVSMTNRSNVTLTIESLISDKHGDILVENLEETTCTAIDTVLPENAVQTCSYQVVLTEQPSSYINTVTATVSNGNNDLEFSDDAVVIVGDLSPFEVVLTANPSSLVAPGGESELTVRVINNQSSNLLLDELADSELGDLDGLGDCETPQVIPANQEYVCSYPVTISNMEPGDIVTHTVTAVAGDAQEIATVAISITTQIHGRILLPAISLLSRAGEPHDNACAAMPILTNHTYYGLPDDQWDFYKVTITSSSHLIVYIKDFMVLDGGQLIIFGQKPPKFDCRDLEFITSNGQRYLEPERMIDLGLRDPGTYYVAVYVQSEFNHQTPYQLYVLATTP